MRPARVRLVRSELDLARLLVPNFGPFWRPATVREHLGHSPEATADVAELVDALVSGSWAGRCHSPNSR
jgi:hypothetical protein